MSTSQKAKLASLAVALFIAACAERIDKTPPPSRDPAGFKLSAPMGLDITSATFSVPDDNPITEDKIKLGKRLFFDKSLSIDGSLSCASCHVPENAFSDSNRFSIGVKSRRGTRQSPTLINRAFSRAQFWDGRAPSLEEQALVPLTNPVEMGNPSLKIVLKRLENSPSYIAAFKQAFPDTDVITEQHLSQAIASFERTILAGNSPFDRFINGDKSSMSEAATRGYRIFLGKGLCAQCHLSFNFTDEIYHNLGVGALAKKPDPGRFTISKLDGHQGAFKTPTLREVASTAPYMSDGSLKTLEEVIEYYDKGGQPNPWLSPKIKPLNLNDQEKTDLVEFLKTLSGEISWYGKDGDLKRAAGAARTPPRMSS